MIDTDSANPWRQLHWRQFHGSLCDWKTGLASMILVIALSACSRPQPPTLTPEVARVVAVSATGLDIDVEVKVDNPNTIPLTAEMVSGTLFVAEGQKLAHGSS